MSKDHMTKHQSHRANRGAWARWSLAILAAGALLPPLAGCDDTPPKPATRPAAAAPAAWREKLADQVSAAKIREEARQNAQGVVDAMNANLSDAAIAYQGRLAEFTGSMLQSDSDRLIIGEAGGTMVIILLKPGQVAPTKDNPPAAVTALGVIQLVDPRPREITLADTELTYITREPAKD
jgi:hypothetical protein